MKSNRWLSVVVLAALAGALGAGPARAQIAANPLKYDVGMFGKFTTDGVLIQKVVSGTPADKAGIQVGDLVTVINSSGGQVVCVVRKGGNGKIHRVGLDLTGTCKNGPPSPYFLGITGTFTRDGAVVNTVLPGTPAARVGLAKGDLIYRINGLPVVTQEDFFAVLYKSGGTVTLNIKKADGKLAKHEVDLTTYELGVVGEFNRDGMVIGAVAPLTPAAYVGLQKGDAILRIDNQPVRSQKEFDKFIAASGGSVSLLVQRPGQRAATIQVDLMNNQLGAWCEPSKEGMRITTVVAGGPAAAIGLERGDVIVRIDDRRVESNAELVNALRNARGLVTMVVRKGGVGRLVKLDVDLAR